MTSDRVSICSNIATFAMARYSFSRHPGTVSDGRNTQQQELTVGGEPAHLIGIKNAERAHSVGLKSQEPVFGGEPALEPGHRGRRVQSDQCLTYMGLLLGCTSSLGHDGTLVGGASRVERKGEGGLAAGEEGRWESEENWNWSRLAKVEVRRNSASFIEQVLDELITSKADCTSTAMGQKTEAQPTMALGKRPFRCEGATPDAPLNSFSDDKNNNSLRQNADANLWSTMTFSNISGSYSLTSQNILPPLNSSGNAHLASSSSSSSSPSSSCSSSDNPCSLVRPFHSLDVALEDVSTSVTLAKHGSGCHIISSPGTTVSLTTCSLPSSSSSFPDFPYQLPVPVCDSSLSFQPSACHSPFSSSNSPSPSTVASGPASIATIDSDGSPVAGASPTPVKGRPLKTHPGCSTIKYNRRKGRTGTSASQEEEEEQNKRRIHFCDYPSKLQL